MSRRALVFDFDGTIALSEPVHIEAWKDVAKLWQRPLPNGFLERGIGLSDEQLSAELAVSWQDSPDYATLLAAKRKAYQTRCPTESILVPGIAAALASLAEFYPLGIATSACVGDIEPVLTRFGLAHYFSAIVTIADVTHAKPDPEIYLTACARLGAEPELCVAFEDSLAGVTAARSAGLSVVALLTTYERPVLEPVAHALRDFIDLAALLNWLRPE